MVTLLLLRRAIHPSLACDLLDIGWAKAADLYWAVYILGGGLEHNGEIKLIPRAGREKELDECASAEKDLVASGSDKMRSKTVHVRV